MPMAGVGTVSHDPPSFPEPFESKLSDRLAWFPKALDDLSIRIGALNILRHVVFGTFWILVITVVAGLSLRAWTPDLLERLALLPPGRLETLLLGDQGVMLLALCLGTELKRRCDRISIEISRTWEPLRYSLIVSGKLDEYQSLGKRIATVMQDFAQASDLALTGYRSAGMFYAVIGLLLVIAEAVISRTL